MTSLRENYLEAVKLASKGQRPRKVLVSKSANGPPIYCIRDHTGEVVGYAPGETLSPDELQKVMGREDVAKSAEIDDPNSCFDESPLMPEFNGDGVQSSGVTEVTKSAENDDPDLVGLFPSFLRPSR